MISLFYPYVSKRAIKEVKRTLKTRWIGQAHKVDQFEKEFSIYCQGINSGVAVNSGTSALHLAYILAGIQEGDEVVTPVLTCTATNIPLLYLKAKPVFVDINKSDLNINIEDLKRKITNKTKAIIVVHFGGIPVDLKEIREIAKLCNLPIIEDAAQAIGAEYWGHKIGAEGDFVAFSFQAIKALTTGDGGMLMIHNYNLIQKAKRLRWFGIDRELRIKKDWQPVWGREMTYDVSEIGYKYQMTDISASLGLANLIDLDKLLKIRREIVQYYREKLENVPGLTLLKEDDYKESSNWLFQVLVENRDDFQKKLKEQGIETNVSHIRNDIYTIFGGKRLDLPNMDQVESQYICLPLHHRLNKKDLKHIIKTIKSGW